MGGLYIILEAAAEGRYSYWIDIKTRSCALYQTFQAYMQFKEIPRKVVVAKRLAQCLNPALPTGVHQRALDVYAHILAVLGVRSHYSIQSQPNRRFFLSPKDCIEIWLCGRPGCSRSLSMLPLP